MRLLTANVFTGRADVRAFERVLDAEQPDVVVCQEVGTDVAEMLDARFSHGVVVGDDVGYAGRAMLSNHALDVRDLPMRYRPGLWSITRVGDVDVVIIGVHLANPANGLRAVSDRRAQVDAVLTKIDAVGTPAVVLGDLNATPLWPAYRRLRRRLRDGVSDHHMAAGTRPRRTWTPRPGWVPILRIDHVLTAGVRLDDVRVHAVAGSDHLAVAATVVGVRP